ncbi:hypothetical protein NDU88_004279 [Pleurodeles waltl]|uniref:Uncharacterized protein n=1 Tax=Pleurodeles waltl TaxID=8319 RepID=A0AAV7TS54_PLEWA|nr:hypothetical protein NDU88_004279 [Pleurodeles waltl]
MQSSVGRQRLISTKLGLKSHWTVGVTWTEFLSSRDHARRAERGPRGPVMQSFVASVAEGRFRRPTGDFFRAPGARRWQATPRACTTRKQSRWRQDQRYKVAVVVFATLLRFCRRPEQSAVDPLPEGEERDAEELG